MESFREESSGLGKHFQKKSLSLFHRPILYINALFLFGWWIMGRLFFVYHLHRWMGLFSAPNKTEEPIFNRFSHSWPLLGEFPLSHGFLHETSCFLELGSALHDPYLLRVNSLGVSQLL